MQLWFARRYYYWSNELRFASNLAFIRSFNTLGPQAPLICDDDLDRV